MAAKQVIAGVHVVPMGDANAFLIEGNGGPTLIDAGFLGKASAVPDAIQGLGRSPDHQQHLVLALGPHRQHGDHRARNGREDVHARARRTLWGRPAGLSAR